MRQPSQGLNCICSLKMFKEAVGNVLDNELPKCSEHCLLTDIWTSRNNDAYMSLTLHYITHEFQLKKFVIYCSPFEGSQH